MKVVAALIANNNQVLITKRLKGEFKGMWEFPGGKVEEGENPETALIREIHEELNIHIQIKQHLMTAFYQYPSFHLEMDCYICTSSTFDLKLVDHSESLWIEINEKCTNAINWIPADVQVFEKLVTFLTSG